MHDWTLWKDNFFQFKIDINSILSLLCYRAKVYPFRAIHHWYRLIAFDASSSFHQNVCRWYVHIFMVRNFIGMLVLRVVIFIRRPLLVAMVLIVRSYILDDVYLTMLVIQRFRRSRSRIAAEREEISHSMTSKVPLVVQFPNRHNACSMIGCELE